MLIMVDFAAVLVPTTTKAAKHAACEPEALQMIPKCFTDALNFLPDLRVLLILSQDFDPLAADLNLK